MYSCSSDLSLFLHLSKGQLVISPTDLCLSAGCSAQASGKLILLCNGRAGNAMRTCMTQSNKCTSRGKSLPLMPRKSFTGFFSPCIQLGANSLSSVSSAGGQRPTEAAKWRAGDMEEGTGGLLCGVCFWGASETPATLLASQWNKTLCLAVYNLHSKPQAVTSVQPCFHKRHLLLEVLLDFSANPPTKDCS